MNKLAQLIGGKRKASDSNLSAEASENPNLQQLTNNENVVSVLKQAFVNEITDSTQCSICLEDFSAPNTGSYRLSECQGHYFHSECISKQLEINGKCCICSKFYMNNTGNQPIVGTMSVNIFNSKTLPLEGYSARKIGTIEIIYSFPSGVQTADMPNPGRPYSGTFRRAYLPNNREGREILNLLKVCFQRRLTFTVGQSLTTGRSDTVIWNGVHHKTQCLGGPVNFGYPDDSYLLRVREELRAKGIC